jgi:D-glycero-D-manno-heptose 1,7-bisphosphate phosphatase
VSGRAAVFLDRDGTIIEDPGYLSDPDRVHLLPGAAEAVARLNRAGRLVVVVTNQSGIARGLLSEAQYFATERRLDELLAARGARIDAHRFCPHHPDVTGPCECRKPGLLLYRAAAERLGIDLAASWWVGDRLRDVSPAEALGGRGILVGAGAGAERFASAADLPGAVELILRSDPRT